jgi:hypothetical protein
MSDAFEVIFPSAVVTRVSSPEIALALVETLLFVVVNEDSRVVISEALEVMFPSAVVTRAPSELIALALVVISPSAVVRSAWSVVTSAEIEVMLFSLDVTRVVSEESPEAFAATPVVGSLTVDSRSVIALACVVSSPSATVVRESRD